MKTMRGKASVQVQDEEPNALCILLNTYSGIPFVPPPNGLQRSLTVTSHLNSATVQQCQCCRQWGSFSSSCAIRLLDSLTST